MYSDTDDNLYLCKSVNFKLYSRVDFLSFQSSNNNNNNMNLDSSAKSKEFSETDSSSFLKSDEIENI